MTIGFKDKRVAQILKRRSQALPDIENSVGFPYAEMLYPYTIDLLIAYSPTGGIPGRDGTNDKTIHGALCTIQKFTQTDSSTIELDDAKIDDGTTEMTDADPWQEMVFNMSKGAVGANKLLVIALTKYGFWIVIVEDCDT